MQKPYIVVFAYGKFVLCTNSQMLERHNKRKPLSGRMEDFMKYEVIYKTSTSFVVELKENGYFSSETEHEIYVNGELLLLFLVWLLQPHMMYRLNVVMK